MANVVRTQELQPDIDYHLDYQLEAQWSTMDSSEREIFHLEWVGITESRLQQLEQWSREGRLSKLQRARYHELLQLVTRNRPALEHLLGT
jgi:hypothetical protein